MQLILEKLPGSIFGAPLLRVLLDFPAVVCVVLRLSVRLPSHVVAFLRILMQHHLASLFHDHGLRPDRGFKEMIDARALETGGPASMTPPPVCCQTSQLEPLEASVRR